MGTTNSLADRVTRRVFLRASGVSLALPWLAALQPRRASAADARMPRRMVAICTPLGLHPQNFFPEKAGKEYELTPYLDVLKDFRDDLTGGYLGGGFLSSMFLPSERPEW